MEMVLLANLLGGPGANSRLNQQLREKNALVYAIDASFTQFADNGSLMIYFGCEKPNLDRCISLVHGELAALRDKPLSERALRAAKKQLLGQLAIASPMKRYVAASMPSRQKASSASPPPCWQKNVCQPLSSNSRKGRLARHGFGGENGRNAGQSSRSEAFPLYSGERFSRKERMPSR